jgi:hypothetical protein
MLVDLPKIADAQREALQAIGREMQTGRQIDETMVQTVEHLREAVSTWSDNSNAAANAMNRLQETASKRDDRLAQLMTEQNRRFTWFMVLTAVLAVAATATGVLTLMR